MTQLTLIRHTKTEIEPGYCVGGGTQLPLVESFLEEAAAIRALLPQEFDHYFTSPLERCTKLANHLFPAVKWQEDARLAEIHFGEWEGKRWDDLAGPALDAWMADFVNEVPPGGESTLKLQERVELWMAQVSHAGGNYAVVTHGGVIRMMVAVALGMPLDSLFQIEAPYSVVVELSFKNGQWHLSRLSPPNPK
jgi:alpha-ribazole phosphatase